MPRIDDYIAARKMAIEKLATESFETICERAGFDSEDGESLRVPFLNRDYAIHYPDFEFNDQNDPDREIPIQEQILILHYMMAPKSSLVRGPWVSYREIPGASFYFSAFIKRAIDPLKNVFGHNPENLTKAANFLGGIPIEPGDVGFEFLLFPNVPLQLILYVGDEEFPAEANILFDHSVGEILSPEDIAWLAGMLVYRLIALSKN
jgi:hypothetical protein